MYFEKVCSIVYGNSSLKISVLVKMKFEKKCVLLFIRDSLKVSVSFDIKFEKLFHVTLILLSVCSCGGSIERVSTGCYEKCVLLPLATL